MQKDKKYFDRTEDEDALRMQRLATETGWWSTITPNEYGAPIDFEGDAIDKRHTLIEVKYRDMDADAYDDYFIEVDKLADCYLHAAMTHPTPLYINFFKDGNVLIWNLLELKTMPIKEKIRRANKGFDTMEVSNVYKLAASDAYKYTFKSL